MGDRAAEFRIGIDRRTLLGWSCGGWRQRAGRSSRPRVADIKGMADMMREVGWTKQNRAGDVERFIDWSFLKKASGQGEGQLRTYEWRPKT